MPSHCAATVQPIFMSPPWLCTRATYLRTSVTPMSCNGAPSLLAPLYLCTLAAASLVSLHPRIRNCRPFPLCCNGAPSLLPPLYLCTPASATAAPFLCAAMVHPRCCLPCISAPSHPRLPPLSVVLQWCNQIAASPFALQPSSLTPASPFTLLSHDLTTDASPFALQSSSLTPASPFTLLSHDLTTDASSLYLCYITASSLSCITVRPHCLLPLSTAVKQPHDCLPVHASAVM